MAGVLPAAGVASGAVLFVSPAPSLNPEEVEGANTEAEDDGTMVLRKLVKPAETMWHYLNTDTSIHATGSCNEVET